MKDFQQGEDKVCISWNLTTAESASIQTSLASSFLSYMNGWLYSFLLFIFQNIHFSVLLKDLYFLIY